MKDSADDIAGLSERLRKTLAGVEPDDFRGDNLAIFIASELEPSIEDETLDDSLTWKQGAVDACDRVLDAIHAHYATAIDSLQARVEELEAERDRHNTEVRLWKIEHDRKLDSTRRRVARLQQELDTSNDNHRAMEKQLAMVGEDRDDAYERAAQQAEQFAPPHSMDLGKGHVAWRIADAIRRLAEPEKEGE